MTRFEAIQKIRDTRGGWGVQQSVTLFFFCLLELYAFAWDVKIHAYA